MRIAGIALVAITLGITSPVQADDCAKTITGLFQGGAATVPIPGPNRPELRGLQFHAQAGVISAGGNAVTNYGSGVVN